MAMAQLPVPMALDIHDVNAADKWRKFLNAWTNYALATELYTKPQPVQVATLLTVIGEDSREVYSTFKDWAGDGDARRIKPVLQRFAAYCEPRKNVPFERYKFNKRVQEAGEQYEQYKTALLKLAETCDFETITPNDILRNRLIFGICDNKVRERLLGETGLTIERTDEIWRAAEMMTSQMKTISDSDTAVHSMKVYKSRRPVDSKRDVSSASCSKCGRRHDLRQKESCPAFGKQCHQCRRRDHFAAKCKSAVKERSVRVVDAESAKEVFTLSGVSKIDAAQIVTLQLDSGNYLHFQIDSGAQCNVVPMSLYEKATGAYERRLVTPVRTSIVAYGGSKLPVIGEVRIRVSRRDFTCKLDCKLVDSDLIRPILGRRACIGMHLIDYHDNDALNKPETSTVYSVNNAPIAITKESLITRFPKVFEDGVGLLAGEHHINLDVTVDAVQHAPRRVPVAMRELLKDSLDELQDQQIVTPVMQPTQWISSLVVVPKKDSNNLRICLDPTDLNRAIQRENYPLPTIEDVATRLHGAKVFSLLDVRSGFWHVKLDEPSSYLTTFNTLFGRYRWKRLPFGICSAPEIFQRKMHQLIE